MSQFNDSFGMVPPMDSSSQNYPFSGSHLGGSPFSVGVHSQPSIDRGQPFVTDFSANHPFAAAAPGSYAPYADFPYSYQQQPACSYSYYPSPSFCPPRHVTQPLSANTKSFVPHSFNNDEANVIDLEKVKSGQDQRTTLMIRNIPNGYVFAGSVRPRFSRKVFVKILNQTCRNRYDFLYLPFDEKTNCNMGYGYVNMIDLESVCLLYNSVGGGSGAEA